jgi:FkbM family methyltransferase
MAERCRDADSLAKVANAGAVIPDCEGPPVQIMFNGLRVRAGGYYGDWMQELITRCRGHHEPQEEVVFSEILKHLPHNARMIELGGYWSFYTLWFLSDKPERRAIVVEPDPAHLAVGQENASLNSLEPCFVNAFVGRIASSAVPFVTEKSGRLELPCVSVPSLIADHAIGQLDLLHCDAQGIELEVIDSCRPLVEAGRINIVVSTHAHQISGDPLTHQRCIAALRNMGATILAEHDVHESFSGDGLIAAVFGERPADWRAPILSYNRYSQSLFRNPLYDLALARVAGSAGGAAPDGAEPRVGEGPSLSPVGSGTDAGPARSHRRDLSIIVPTIDSKRYIDVILRYYRESGIEVEVFIDSKSCDSTPEIVQAHYPPRFIRNDATRVGEIIEAMSIAVGARWVLRLDDDELPSRAMLDFVADAITRDDADAYSFARHQCVVSKSGTLLRSTAFNPLNHQQWRLYQVDKVRYTSAGHTPGFLLDGLRLVVAPVDAAMIHLDWAVHSFDERQLKVSRYNAHTPGHGSTWESYYLFEADPVLSRSFEPLALPEFDVVARRLAERLPDLLVELPEPKALSNSSLCSPPLPADVVLPRKPSGRA